MYKLTRHSLNINKINSSKNFKIEEVKGKRSLSYRGTELLQSIKGIPMLSRKRGYRAPLDELRKIGIMIMSVEENQNNELFHKNYYFTIKKIENGITTVLIKHFDVPMLNMGVETADYLQMAKNIAEQDTSLSVVVRPTYEKDLDHMMKPNCLRFRPNNYGSYFFEAKFDVFKYGDLCVKVDFIVTGIENEVRKQIMSNTP